MLLFQYEEQRVLELLEFVVVATRYCDTFAFATRRLLLDEMLDIVIIDVVYEPTVSASALIYVSTRPSETPTMPPRGYRSLPQRLAVLHPSHTTAVATAIAITTAEDKLIYHHNTDENGFQGLAARAEKIRYLPNLFLANIALATLAATGFEGVHCD